GNRVGDGAGRRRPGASGGPLTGLGRSVILAAARLVAEPWCCSPSRAARAKGGTLPGRQSRPSRPCSLPLGAPLHLRGGLVPTNKDLKRLVRSRAAATGERYTEARSAIAEAGPVAAARRV